MFSVTFLPLSGKGFIDQPPSHPPPPSVRWDLRELNVLQPGKPGLDTCRVSHVPGAFSPSIRLSLHTPWAIPEHPCAWILLGMYYLGDGKDGLGWHWEE